MTIATNQQVQTFSDATVRPNCETVRNMIDTFNAALAAIGDIYSACAQQSPTWTDNRTDGPPHLATPSDILAWNTFAVGLVSVITGTATDSTATLSLVQGIQGQWPVIQKLCVRPFLG